MIEKLVKQQIGPLGANIEVAQTSADVASVQDNVRYELFGILDCILIGRVNQQVPILGVLDAEAVQVLLELGTKLLHLRHVGREYAMHDSFPDDLDLISLEAPREEVIIEDVKQLECLRGMKVLLN